MAGRRQICGWMPGTRGVVLRHGLGPDSCDAYGARDAWVYEANGAFIMHYDGAGPSGWLSVRARSADLLHWTIDGPVLTLGKDGEDDSKRCLIRDYRNGRQ